MIGLGAANTASAGAPKTVLYQGALYEAGAPADGDFDVDFKLYTKQSGGKFLTTLGATTVAVVDGTFSVDVGDLFASLDEEEVWLEVSVKGVNDSEFDLLPRTRVASVPYALNARSADSVEWANVKNAPTSLKGDTGAPGAAGAIGPQGLPGAAGAQGIQGVAGTPGAAGATGAQGPVGATGAGGAAGESVVAMSLALNDAHCAFGGSSFALAGEITYACNGVPGTPGRAADEIEATLLEEDDPDCPTGGMELKLGTDTYHVCNGEIGHSGTTGAQGAAGSVGPAGPVGPSGVAGPVGPAGAQGNVGPAGSAGPAGPVGSVGPAGAQGATGAAGQSVVAMSMAPGGSCPTGGVSLTVGANVTYVCNGAAGATGSAGPQGATGAQGPAGSVGPQGTTGAQGPVGATGAQGPVGATGVGTVGPAGATGATGAPGPAGATGATGATGAQGSQGPAGSSGATNPVRDANGQLIGTLIALNRGNFQVLTTTAHAILMNFDGTVGSAQIYWTGAGCGGTPYLNSGGSTSTSYGKWVVRSGVTGKLFVPTTINGNNASISVGFTASTIENPTCASSAGSRDGWLLTEVAQTAVGLPATITPPFTF